MAGKFRDMVAADKSKPAEKAEKAAQAIGGGAGKAANALAERRKQLEAVAGMKKGGSCKAKGYAKGGGIELRGKTKGRMV